MPYPLMNIQNGYNVSQGMHIPLVYVNSGDVTNGLFMRLFFVFLFLGVSMASYYAQMRRGRDVNFFAVLSVVGIGVLMMMTMLSMIPGLVTGFDLITGLVIEILCLFVLFLTDRQS